jgi:uncharacterized cupin superfamily protein
VTESVVSQIEVNELQAGLASPQSLEDPVRALNLDPDTAGTDLKTFSIPSAWLITGEARTRSRFLGNTRDRLAYAIYWECGAAHFNWHYSDDEFIIILSGGVFVTDKHGRERHYGPSDFAFFPAGSQANWRVPDHIKKIAVIKRSINPITLMLKVCMKLLAIAGLSRNVGSKDVVIAKHPRQN